MAIPISGTFEPDGNFKLVDAQHISLGEETLSTTVNTIKTNNDELVQINANSLDYNLSDLSVETSDPSSVYAVSASKKSIKVEHRNDPHSIKVWIPIRGLEIGKTYNFSAVYTRNGTDTSASIRLFQSNKTTSILPVYETSESVQSFVATEDMLYIRVYCAGAQAWVDINNISIIEVRAAIKGNVTVGNMTANVLTQKIKTLDSGIEDGTSFAIGQLNDTQSLIIEDNDIKKNNQISFFGKISTFTQLSVGHGKAVMYANYVKIDDTNLKIMSGEGDTVAVTEAHNLTIADYISVIIKVGKDRTATIILGTSGGSFTLEDQAWDGCNGDVFALSSGSNLTNCRLTWSCDDYKKKIWAFGDSYFTHVETRWPYHVITWGFDNMLLDGYAGRNSVQAYPSFLAALKHGTPKYVFWCLGMNDPDDSAVDASWLTVIQNVISKCLEKGITPILATIPSTPTNDNSYKNAWVKASGYRYVDFEAAVVSSGTTWYTGMLNTTDNVHPTAIGASALAFKAISDLPELMQS